MCIYISMESKHVLLGVELDFIQYDISMHDDQSNEQIYVIL